MTPKTKIKTKVKRPVPSIREATGRVARAEQRLDRATTALDAAESEWNVAKKALGSARVDLRAASRAQIERQKDA